MQFNEFKQKVYVGLIKNYLDKVSIDEEGVEWFWKSLWEIKKKFPELDIYPAGTQGYIGIGKKLSLDERVSNFTLVAAMRVDQGENDSKEVRFTIEVVSTFYEDLLNNNILHEELELAFSREDDRNKSLEEWLSKIRYYAELLALEKKKYSLKSKGLLPKDYFEISITNSYIDDDLEQIYGATEPKKAIRTQLVETRNGQGQYRKQLIERFMGRCILTGIDLEPLLFASHIKAWRDCSSDDERLDPKNGLLLFSPADALFDRYLISFEPDSLLLVIQNDPKIKSLVEGYILKDINLSEYYLDLYSYYNHEEVESIRYYLKDHYSKFKKLKENQ